MKIFLSPSNQDENKYAYGNTNEMVQCGEVAKLLKAALERHGFEVMLMHSETIATKVKKANEWGADYYIPIHSNAFNGQVSGTRMFYYTENELGHQMTSAIFKRLAPVTPGTSENIKHATYAELKQPNAWTSYIEIDFHDVPSVAKWIIEHHSEIAEAICHGICDHCGVEYRLAEAPAPAPAPAPEAENTTLYRVQVGAFRVRENAEKMRQKLQDAGFPGFVTEAK